MRGIEARRAQPSERPAQKADTLFAIGTRRMRIYVYAISERAQRVARERERESAGEKRV